MIRIIVEHFQKHGSNAESNFEQRFLRSREKSELQSKRQGPKLYSKVLTIEPNRLLSKCSLFGKGARLHLCSAIVLLLCGAASAC
jgi:hypothetical protein